MDLEAANVRSWALPGHLRRTVQLSCYGDLAPLFRQANLPVLKACLQASSLWGEVAMFDRLLYKNTHQHRGAHFMRYLKEARRTLNQLRELHLEGLVDDLYFMLQQGGALPAATSGAPGAGRAAVAAASRSGGGGRVSYRLPSREAAAAVLKQLILGSALVMGIQRTLHSAAAHLAAQLALTFFVPLATTAVAMLARIKVLSLQLLLDCVRAYNAVADLLPALPPAGTSDLALVLQPELAAVLQPLPLSLQSSRGQGDEQPRVTQQPGGSVEASRPQLQGQGQPGGGEETRSRSLRQMLKLAPEPPKGVMVASQPPRPAQQIQQPTKPVAVRGEATGAIGAAVERSVSCRTHAAAACSTPVPLPQMVRCRWDEHVQTPYLEPVTGGGTVAEPTWQERSDKIAEQYGYMIAVQLDEEDTTAAAAAATAAEAQRGPATTGGAGGNPQARSQLNAGGAAASRMTRGAGGAASGAKTAAAAAGSSEVGLKVDRKSFFDLMSARRPTGPGAAAGSGGAPPPQAATASLAAGGKRSHAAQAMVPLQVFEDRGAKRRRGDAAMAGAAAAGAGAAPAAAGAAVAAAGSRIPTHPSAAAATHPALSKIPSIAGSAPVAPSASPVVLSYATRHGFVLGLSRPSGAGGTSGQPGGTAAADEAVGAAPCGDQQPQDRTETAATATAAAATAIREHGEAELASQVPCCDVALGTAGSVVPDGGVTGVARGGPAGPPAAAPPVPVTRGSVISVKPQTKAKPAFLSVPPASRPPAAGTSDPQPSSAAGAPRVGPHPDPDPIRAQTAPQLPVAAAAAAGESAAVDDPLLGVILQGRGGASKGRGRGVGTGRGGRGGGVSADGKPGAVTARSGAGRAPAAAASAAGGGGGSLAASLEVLLGGLAPLAGGLAVPPIGPSSRGGSGSISGSGSGSGRGQARGGRRGGADGGRNGGGRARGGGAGTKG